MIMRLGEKSLPFLALIIVIFSVWQVSFEITGNDALSSPLATIKYAALLVRSDSFWLHLTATLKTFSIAFAVAAVLGVLGGVILGAHRLAGDVLSPVIASLYAIPKVTLYPVILLLVGIGMPARVTFAAIHGLIPILLFTAGAVRNIDPVLIKTARVLRFGTLVTARRIFIPATVPEIISGLRVAFSLTLMGTLVAEMFGSQRGLGFMLMNAIGLHHIVVIMALTLLLSAFAILVNATFLALNRMLNVGRT